MDKAMVLGHLEQARRHVAEGEKRVASQCELVTELERDGHDSSQARQLLREFEEVQRLHLEHRDRLEKILEAMPD
jgi:hypothetical protein